jgi:hypothetical protein
MNSYEQYSMEFNRNLEVDPSANQTDECDYFFEYIKFLKKEKKRKNSTKSLEILNLPCLTKGNIFQFNSYFVENKDYQIWIKIQVISLISSELIRNEMLLSCLGIFENNLVLCEIVFPYLIRTILLMNPNSSKLIGKSFKEIFDIDFNCINKEYTKILDIKRFLKLFVGTIDFLRTHSKKIK